MRFRPLIQVHIDDLFPVMHYIDLIRLAGDRIVIPFAGFILVLFFRSKRVEFEAKSGGLNTSCVRGGDGSQHGGT